MGMWVEGYSMYEKERWDEAERYGKEIGRSEGLNEGLAKGMSKGLAKGRNEGRETANNAWIANLRQLGISEDVINAAVKLNTKSVK